MALGFKGLGPMKMFERKPAGVFWGWFQASPWILVAKEGKLDTSTNLLFLCLPFGTETSLWYQLWHPLSQGNSKRPLGSCRLACEWFPEPVVAATKKARPWPLWTGEMPVLNEDTVHAERKPGPKYVPRMFLHQVGHELAIVVLLAISQSIHSQSYEHFSYSPDD